MTLWDRARVRGREDDMPGATAQRTNNGWLAAWERQTLSTFAAAMPSWVTPDLLTAVGVAGGLIIFGA